MGGLFFLILVLGVHGNLVMSEVTAPILSCPAGCICLLAQQHIMCTNASLTSPPSGVPKNTAQLHLQHNNFPTLPSSFVQDLPKLTGLYLSNCNISTIQAGAFQGATALHHLYLDWNQLDDLEIDTFSNLRRLQYLYLENNKIRHLRAGVFSHLKDLSALYLSHNLLNELSDGALKGLSNVRWLDLGYNMIANMTPWSFIHVRNLRKLNLERNNLTEIPLPIKAISALHTLRLSGNQIKILISTDFFWNVGALTQLYLDNMGLEKVTSLTFSRLVNLEVLDLRHNNLTSLSVSLIEAFIKIYLSGNPWHCDCAIIGLHTRLQLNKVRDTDEQAVCQSPTALKGQRLANVDLKKLTCPAFVEDVITTKATEDRLTKPTIHPVTTASTVTMKATTEASITTYKTSPPKTFSQTTSGDKAVEDSLDPCLADAISNVLVSSSGEKAPEISWTDSGDYNQFELRYSNGANSSAVHIIGEPMHVRLYSLDPGTTYTVCIVPQNVHISKCQVPKARQCASGQTDGASEQPIYVISPAKTTPLLLIIGVSIAVIVLVVSAIVIVCTIRSRKIEFQRYYNEDGAESSKRQDPYKMDGIYENIDEDRYIYVTPSSLWAMDNDKLDCSAAEPVPLLSLPKYVTL
ncbi:uncharacterized protein O3C94_015126 [Discoglossus pictus]